MSQDKRTRQHENRRKRLAEEAAAKQKVARRKQLRSFAIAAVFVVVAGIAFVFLTDSGDEPTVVATTTTTTTSAPTTSDGANGDAEVATAEYLAFRAQPVACGEDLPAAAKSMTFTEPEDLGIPADGAPTAILRTSCGDVTIELDPSIAPETVNSFAFLAEQGYFNGSISHRIIPSFMIQMGDPTATGSGGPGYVIADEFPEPGFVYDRGVVAMANAGANSTGSQFFLVLAPTSLGPNFSVFGTVVDGFDALDAIAEVPLAPRGNEVSLPLESVFIESVTIER